VSQGKTIDLDPHLFYEKTMTTDQDLFAALDALNISRTVIEHPPLFTVEDGRDWHDKIPGMHGKNLFMKDKKGKLWLVVMPGDKRALMGPLEKAIGSARLSFGSPELLLEVLGTTPGSVTPFALLNDHKRQVTVVLDPDLMAAGLVNVHPMRNTASVGLLADDLRRFIESLGYIPLMANCGVWPEVG